ncbi:MAG TPA: YicC/YloC family endoribonuclease [Bacteroidota bacterium]|nr:YicC/YloC family endoribonuclease [Bacteroidota bacterium]
MTGYGRAEVSKKDITATVEVRSVNSRFLEVTTRLPRTLSHRENDVKELVKGYVTRGKVSVQVSLAVETDGALPVKINVDAAKAYYKLLDRLRKEVKLKEPVNLSHLLQFSEVLEGAEENEVGEREWQVVEQALHKAMKEFNVMRAKEGKELAKDLKKRIEWIDSTVDRIEQLSKERIPEERKRLQERIAQLLGDKTVIDQNRLELEIALLSDKLDVTEECVRYHSHNKFFLETMVKEEAAGRKLNFLVQEMNREANTIGSKSSDATIAHLVVQLKEELEKIREQLQNIE